MGAVISQLGFNQAFLLALIGIIAMLGLTVVAVSGDSRDNHQNDYALPLATWPERKFCTEMVEANPKTLDVEKQFRVAVGLGSVARAMLKDDKPRRRGGQSDGNISQPIKARNVISCRYESQLFFVCTASCVLVCRDHFVQTSLYITWEFEQLWPDFSQSGLDNAPISVVCDLLAHIRMYASMLNDLKMLTEEDVVSFYNNNVIKYYNGVLNKLALPDHKEQNLTSPSKQVVCGDNPSTSQDSSADVISVSKASCPSQRFACSLCQLRYSSPKLRLVSESTKENIILLSCLVMDNTIEMDVAKKICKEICHHGRLLCKNHFVQAAWTLGDEVRQMWSRFPVLGLQRIPVQIQEDLLKRIQMLARTIRKDIAVSLMDLWKFYDFCQSIYKNTKDAASQKTVIEGLENQHFSFSKYENPCSLSSDDDEKPTSINEDEECSGEENVLHGRKSPNVGKKRILRNICLICHRSHPRGEMRSSSRTLDQFLILLSCMIINHHMDLEDAEHAYDQMSMKKKYVCQRHYIQAAKYMCVEVERNTGMSITPGCTKVPIETWKVISKSIKDYCELVDKSVPIFEENIGRFYSDCVTKYYVSGGWKTDLEEQIRAPKSQESNNEDPLVASVSALIPTKEGRLNDSGDQKPNLEKSICTPKPSTTPATSFGATFVKTGHDVKGISYITRDEKVTNPTDDIDASSRHTTDDSPKPAGRWIIERRYRKSPFTKIRCYCGICGQIRLTENLHPVLSQPRALVIISCLLAQDITNVDDAMRYYKEEVSIRRYKHGICEEHLVEAGAYLEAELKRLLGPTPSRKLIEAPVNVVQIIVDRLQLFVDRIDKGTSLCDNDIRLYLKFYLNKYGENDDWKIRWEPDRKNDCETVCEPSRSGKTCIVIRTKKPKNATSLSKPSLTKASQRYTYKKLTVELEPSRGERYKPKQKDVNDVESIHSPVTGSSLLETAVESLCTEYSTGTEVMERTSECSTVPSPSYGYAPASRAVEPQTSEDEFSKLTCSLCGVIGLAMDFRPAATEPQYNIVLLSLLLMQSSMDNARAIAWYNQTQRRQLMICRSHYIKAAARLSMEIKREWGKFPENGLAEVPENIIYSMLTVIRLYRDFIDPKIDLERWHVNEFFDDCLNKYWKDFKWMPYKKRLRVQHTESRDSNKTDNKGSAKENAKESHINKFFDGCLDRYRTKSKRIPYKKESPMKFKWAPYKKESLVQHAESRDSIKTEIEDYDEKEGMDNYGFRELWEKLGNSSNVIPDSSNFDDCLPLFRTEEDVKPVVFDEVSAIDLIEGDGFHSTLTSRNLADHFVEDSPLIRNDEKSWIDTLMQDDDNERNSIQSDQKDHIVLFDSSSLPSTSTAPEPHLDLNLQIKMEIEEDDIAMENTAEDDISMQDLDEDKIMKFLSDRSKSIGELTRELNITSNAVLSYLRCTDAEREMCKWVPSDGILQCRLEICTSLVLRNIRDSILDRIVTYGEKWIYFNNKERPTLWLDDTVKDIEVQSESNPEREKVLLTVWWSSAGIIHHHLVGGGKSMTEDDFIKQISEVYRKMGSKQPAKGPLLLCDNPRPYVSRNSIQKLYLYGIEVLPHPPQSPDLLPSKYHIFRHLNHYLAGRNFYDDVE
ncbi:hypothetical protein RB195_004546 [Necator americanus]|uniref:Lin-15A/B-like domain-containing protein n=1 Tax=Necator americanus TaxID=51031 RepID=A0ABR1BII8_NECAM